MMRSAHTTKAPPRLRHAALNARARRLTSTARMSAPVLALEDIGRDMRVDLRSGKTRMSEHLLDASQIGSPVKKIRRERMTHRMRRQGRIKTRLTDGTLENLANSICAQRLSPTSDEEKRAFNAIEQHGTRTPLVISHQPESNFMNGNDPFLRAFSENPHKLLSIVHAFEKQSGRFGNTKAARVKKLEKGGVAQLLGRSSARRLSIPAILMNSEQEIHVRRAYHLRQRSHTARPLQQSCRIVGDNALRAKPSEETAQGRQPPADRRTRVPRFMKLGEISTQSTMIDLVGLQLRAFAPPQIVKHIRPIRTNRVRRQTSLQSKMTAVALELFTTLEIDVRRIDLVRP